MEVNHEKTVHRQKWLEMDRTQKHLRQNVKDITRINWKHAAHSKTATSTPKHRSTENFRAKFHRISFSEKKNADDYVLEIDSPAPSEDESEDRPSLSLEVGDGSLRHKGSQGTSSRKVLGDDFFKSVSITTTKRESVFTKRRKQLLEKGKRAVQGSPERLLKTEFKFLSSQLKTVDYRTTGLSHFQSQSTEFKKQPENQLV
mmetsp:Transcript_6297/g.8525  ORF Transcript_6297/g.8525 Transcript_6297/m.8525 type:complete len:201 (-) Transcript_6297:62-664(-)